MNPRVRNYKPFYLDETNGGPGWFYLGPGRMRIGPFANRDDVEAALKASLKTYGREPDESQLQRDARIRRENARKKAMGVL